MGIFSRKLFKKLLSFIILFMVLLIVFFPYFWTLMASLKSAADISRPLDFNFKPTLDNWKAMIQSDIPRQIINSFIVATFVVLISLAVGACAAYSFSHFNVGGSATRFTVLLAQMLPPATLIVPLFIIMYYTKLTGTLFAVIIAHLTFILPLITCFLIGFFDGVPKELEEQAMVDGCTEWKAFIKIVIPTVWPGLGAAGLFGFILSWNDVFYALILTTSKTRTLPVGIAGYWTFRGVEMGQMSATIMLAIAPMIIISSLVQKFLLRGLGGGAIKG